MKAYLDTNVLLDVLMESRENNLDSATILKVAKAGYFEAVISTQSILDSYYVSVEGSKTPLGIFKDSLNEILSVVETIAIEERDIRAAVISTNEDFEDACQIECATVAGCDCIISSDKKMKRDSALKVYTPTEFCNKIFGPLH
jgi:predicted nucleic acid-binding protein